MLKSIVFVRHVIFGRLQLNNYMINIIPAKKGSSEWWFMILTANVWAATLFGYAVGFAKTLPILGLFSETIPYIAIVVPLCLSIKYIYNNLSGFDFNFLIFVLIIFCLETLLHPFNDEISKRAYTFFLNVFPCYFIGRMIDINKIDKLLYYVSALGVLITSFYYLKYAQSQANIDTEHYNMDGSYDLLRFSLYVISYAIRNKTIYSSVVSLLSIMMIFSFGTRGPLVCVLVFIISFILFFVKFKHSKIIKVFFILLFICLYRYLDDFMLFLQILLRKLHMSTRIVDKYFLDEIGVSVARDDITDKLLQVMNSSSFPFWGEGLCGSYKYVGIYPHNFFMEIFFSFGYFCGVIIILLLFVLLYRAMIKSRNLIEKSFLLLLFCSSIVKLMMSGSFLDESILFILIGYSLCIIKNRNKYEV